MDRRVSSFASHDVYVAILLIFGSILILVFHRFQIDVVNETVAGIVCTVNPIAQKVGELFGRDGAVFLAYYCWTFLFPAFFAIAFRSPSIRRSVAGLPSRSFRACMATLAALAIVFSYPLSGSVVQDSGLEKLMFSNHYTIPVFSGLLVYLIAVLLAWSACALVAGRRMKAVDKRT